VIGAVSALLRGSVGSRSQAAAQLGKQFRARKPLRKSIAITDSARCVGALNGAPT
jgi:hypothetical protein